MLQFITGVLVCGMIILAILHILDEDNNEEGGC